MEEKTIFEILSDENDLDNIVLADESGAETEFEQEATLTLDGKTYCILCPLDESGSASQIGYVFFVDADADLLQLVSDEATIDAVFALYDKLCEESSPS